MNIRLCKMTKALARQYFSHFEMDSMLFSDDRQFRPFLYSQEESDARVDRYEQLKRIYLAVMLDQEPIGELVLKNMDPEKKHCTMGISLVSDPYKNRGYGTRAEILALEYAFTELGMETVFADSIHRNLRSRHVLEKVGFQETGQDDTFVYYRCDRASWISPKPEATV